MPYNKKQYKDIVDDILDQITSSVVKERHTFFSTKTKYKLDHTSSEDNVVIKDILEVAGLVRGMKYVFEKGRDYRVLEDDNNGNVIEWLNSTIPDNGSEFKIIFQMNDTPSGITDINAGSVVRTIVEAVSREIELLYMELSHVYRVGFIDTASGSALDNVVAILGIKRKVPTFARGNVTFWRDSNPTQITVSEAMLYDGRDSYELKVNPVRINAVSGIFRGSPSPFQQKVDYVLEDNFIRWLPEGKKPDNRKEFSIEYITYQTIIVPAGTRISTFAKQPESIVFFETKQEGTLEKISDDKWETTVPIESLVSGTAGNVLAGTIRVMPKPPMGIDKVINRGNIRGGADAEADDPLRERAKKGLQVKGKATLESLMTALEGIEGVQSPPLIVDMPDGIPGIVKVVVDGGEDQEIQRMIEDTRAAGIKVEFKRPKIVLLDIDVTLIMKEKATIATTGTAITPIISLTQVENKIKVFIASLKIGEDVIVNQLISMLLDMPEVRDVEQLIISAYREEGKGVVTSTHMENIAISEDERPYARAVTVRIEEGAKQWTRQIG